MLFSQVKGRGIKYTVKSEKRELKDFKTKEQQQISVSFMCDRTKEQVNENKTKVRVSATFISKL